jgi:hypothetical protein
MQLATEAKERKQRQRLPKLWKLKQRRVEAKQD